MDNFQVPQLETRTALCFLDILCPHHVKRQLSIHQVLEWSSNAGIIRRACPDDDVGLLELVEEHLHVVALGHTRQDSKISHLGLCCKA